MSTGPLLTVDDLRVGVGREPVRDVVHGVSFAVRPASTLAIVGESGSGKSLTALSLMGLLPAGVRVTGGSLDFAGRSLDGLSTKQWQEYRGREIAMIFQDPLSALNPCMRIGDQVAEVFRRRAGKSRREAMDLAIKGMAEVGIPDAGNQARAYPHEFSGGMRQRVIIAIALALRPTLLIADEPTTALDVTIQAQILRLLVARKEQDNLTMILISHDLGVVAQASNDIAVMYSGRLVERGATAEVLAKPRHPYTVGLLRSIPSRGQHRTELEAIPGRPPDPRRLPAGCAFADRCPMAQQVCREKTPMLRPVGPGECLSACHFAEDVPVPEGVES